MTTLHRQKENLIPNQNLNVSAREIHALLHYMDFAFGFDGSEGMDEFLEGFSEEDDEVWDEEATRSIYEKLAQKSNYFYREGYLSVYDD